MNYFWLTCRHKWFVFLAGLRTRTPVWRLLVHDLSKFSRHELPHYQRQFFGDKDDPQGFARAWLHHQNVNPHHWEYWMPRSGHNRGGTQAVDGTLAMPEWAVREMVADWLGAGRAYTGEWPDVADWTWLQGARPKMRLHPLTSARVDMVIKELQKRAGYFWVCENCQVAKREWEATFPEGCPRCGVGTMRVLLVVKRVT